MTSEHDEFEDLHGNPEDRDDVNFDKQEPPKSSEPEPPLEEWFEDDNDLDQYGQKVQKRIAKEVYKRRSLETSLAEHQAYIAQLHQRLSGIEQRFAGEDQVRQESEAERRLEELRNARRKAYDEGDLDEYEKLDDQYLEARAEVLARKQGQGNGPRTGQAPATPQAQPGVPEPMAGWMADNRAWFNNEQGNAAKVRSANAMFDVLIAEGFDQHDPATYAELDRRLTGAGIKAKRSRDPMGANSTSRVSGGGPGGSREFTSEDARIMRKYGMDPNDPRQRKGYMQDKDGSSPL